MVKEKAYRQLIKKSDPRMTVILPEDVYCELSFWAEYNARTTNDELIARLIATFKYNDEFMNKDRLIRLIQSKKLAYKKPINGSK